MIEAAWTEFPEDYRAELRLVGRIDALSAITPPFKRVSVSLADCGKVALALAPRPLYVPEFYLQNARKKRADERTRTADLISLRVIHHALQRFAGGCKTRISKGFSFLCLAKCCTVLRSRWCQSGVNISLVST